MKTAKSISFELETLKQADRLAKDLGISRNSAVNEALKLWVKRQKKLKDIQELQQASLSIQKKRGNKKELTIWDETLLDGIEDEK